MSKKNLDQEILLLVLSDEEQGISQLVIDISDILDKFNNYSRGYVYDRLLVLIKEGLLMSRSFFYLTEKGKEVAIKLKEERRWNQKG